MASRALMTRFITAASNWAGSTSQRGSPGATSMTTSIVSPTARRIRTSISVSNAFRSAETGRSVWRRANARSCWVNCTPRFSDRSAISAREVMRPLLPPRRIISRQPMAAVSRLLKSWATPPVSWATVSSFDRCSIRWRSVVSRKMQIAANDRAELVVERREIGVVDDFGAAGFREKPIVAHLRPTPISASCQACPTG